MFELIKINKDNFNKFYKLLEQDFVLEERRAKAIQFEFLNNSKFNQNFIYKNNQLMGYICYWILGEVLFIEHFSILKELRGQGIGSKFLKQFLQENNKLVILEVERDVDEISKRRIVFYQKLGFILNKFNYYQPSYHNNGKGVPMFLMSYNRGLDGKEYEECVKILKKEVYFKE